jgi:uncharacterized protein DUF2799
MTRFAIACLLMPGVLWCCALFPISEAECKPPSWQQRGYHDGFSGQFAQDLRLAKECSRFGIQVSEKDYHEGWQAGYWERERLMGHRMRR